MNYKWNRVTIFSKVLGMNTTGEENHQNILNILKRNYNNKFINNLKYNNIQNIFDPNHIFKM